MAGLFTFRVFVRNPVRRNRRRNISFHVLSNYYTSELRPQTQPDSKPTISCYSCLQNSGLQVRPDEDQKCLKFGWIVY